MALAPQDVLQMGVRIHHQTWTVVPSTLKPLYYLGPHSDLKAPFLPTTTFLSPCAQHPRGAVHTRSTSSCCSWLEEGRPVRQRAPPAEPEGHVEGITYVAISPGSEERESGTAEALFCPPIS